MASSAWLLGPRPISLCRSHSCSQILRPTRPSACRQLSDEPLLRSSSVFQRNKQLSVRITRRHSSVAARGKFGTHGTPHFPFCGLCMCHKGLTCRPEDIIYSTHLTLQVLRKKAYLPSPSRGMHPGLAREYFFSWLSIWPFLQPTNISGMQCAMSLPRILQRPS